MIFFLVFFSSYFFDFRNQPLPINSLTTLTIKKNHVELAKKALDALIDMLNDEIEEVRLYSVDGVTTIMKNSDESLRTLYSDQFQNIIVALDDSVSNIRSAVRKLLGACKIREVETLNKVVMQLLRNLQKYRKFLKKWIEVEGVFQQY